VWCFRVAGIMLIATAAPAEAQCAGCRIVSEPFAILGDENEAPVGNIYTIATLADGRFALSFDASADEILVFGRNGRFAERWGRKGDGPGEYRNIRYLLSGEDGLAVVDTRQKRVTILNPSGGVVRTLPFALDPLGSVVWLRDTVFAVSAIDVRPARVGPLVHVVAPGGVRKSFGDEPEGFRFDMPFVARRQMAASGGQLLVADRTRYRITRYDADGRRQQVLERRVGWFRPHVGRPSAPDPEAGPGPFITGIQEHDGAIWVLIAVADSAWSAATTTTHEGMTWSDANRYFDTIIEVLRPEDGRLLASGRLDVFVPEWAGPGLISSYHEDRLGVPRIEIRQLRLVRP
jgi:hypothetical protein